ncbi:sulfate ABC transporter, permease protein CysW [Chitinispirillum alkaliphilum]|nr:sulfate ABC transporter, permease protein CysW [Chitinispirillum alkaliphilum]
MLNQIKSLKKVKSHISEPPLVKALLISVTVLFLFLVLILPLITVFIQAFSSGLVPYLSAIRHPDAIAAVRLTLTTVAIAVPFNVLFGIFAAWAVTKFNFKGKSIILSFMDLPFAVSPVIAGMIFVLLFGVSGIFGPLLSKLDIQIIFALPGIIITTVFVTFSYVARELIPLMQSQGTLEEEAAVCMGAGGWKIFRKITLPNIKWGLLYGTILCSARAIGEFGAVSVVSGHIRGKTNTLPLHIEILYNEYHFVASFAVASLLVALALITLVLRNLLEWKLNRTEQI